MFWDTFLSVFSVMLNPCFDLRILIIKLSYLVYWKFVYCNFIISFTNVSEFSMLNMLSVCIDACISRLFRYVKKFTRIMLFKEITLIGRLHCESSVQAVFVLKNVNGAHYCVCAAKYNLKSDPVFIKCVIFSV